MNGYTTSALLYKQAFMATWLAWWTVVAGKAIFSLASTWMFDPGPGFLQWYSSLVDSGLLQWWQRCCNKHMGYYFLPVEIAVLYSRKRGE